MQEEAAVLGGQRRLDTCLGHIIQTQIDLLARVGIDNLIEQATVAIEDASGGAHQARFDCADRRQIGQQPDVEAGCQGQSRNQQGDSNKRKGCARNS